MNAIYCIMINKPHNGAAAPLLPRLLNPAKLMTTSAQTHSPWMINPKKAMG